MNLNLMWQTSCIHVLIIFLTDVYYSLSLDIIKGVNSFLELGRYSSINSVYQGMINTHYKGNYCNVGL